MPLQTATRPVMEFKNLFKRRLHQALLQKHGTNRFFIANTANRLGKQTATRPVMEFKNLFKRRLHQALLQKHGTNRFFIANTANRLGKQWADWKYSNFPAFLRFVIEWDTIGNDQLIQL